MSGTLVLLRHGHSDWNLNHRFTGWTDIDLTETGIEEARQAGRWMAAAGLRFDAAHVSALRRTAQTVEAALAAMAHPPLPMQTHWRLNERHYGALQGLNKDEIFAIWGEAEARVWWRGYDTPPPALAPDDPRHPRLDPRYAGLAEAELPATESLRDCQRRALVTWREFLAPAVRAGQCLLVGSHGNTLRGLVMHLDQLDARAVETLEIPSAAPLLYRFDEAMRVIERRWLTPEH